MKKWHSLCSLIQNELHSICTVSCFKRKNDRKNNWNNFFVDWTDQNMKNFLFSIRILERISRIVWIRYEKDDEVVGGTEGFFFFLKLRKEGFFREYRLLKGYIVTRIKGRESLTVRGLETLFDSQKNRGEPSVDSRYGIVPTKIELSSLFSASYFLTASV